MYEISGMALDYLVKSLEFKRIKDFNSAAKCLSISWAFNRLQEYTEGMFIADELLKMLSVSEEELICCHEYGCETINRVNLIVEGVERKLHGLSIDKKEEALKNLVDSIEH